VSPSIAFWQGIGGGTAHYRCRTPGGALERLGWDVGYIEEDDDPIEADVLVLQRATGDWLPDMVRELKRRTDTLVVYDIDDWYEEIPDYNLASKTLTSLHHQQVRELMGLADLITVSTPELAEGYASVGPVALLPNYLDPVIWNDNEQYRVPHERVHLGWMGAFHWRSGDLELLKPWLPDFLVAHPEVVLVGAGCPELFDFLGVGGMVSPPLYEEAPNNLRPYEHLPAMLAWFDIGLIPLVRNRFNQCKSWCKGAEYGAMGVPSVASPSREYQSYIRPGINGQLVRKNDWPRRVEMIVDDLTNYRLGARKVAEEFYIDDHVWRWVDAYTEGRARRHQ
jgi:glycosyltransferase involved in cell wall biosynthesis